MLEFYDDPEVPEWANCSSPDCPNKVCTWASDYHCFKCCEWCKGKPWMIARYEATHDMTWEEATRDDDA
jgi:hypothetical protein